MGQIRGFFRSDFSTFGARRQMHWNLIWKSPGMVPFGANLSHFGAKHTIPVRIGQLLVTRLMTSLEWWRHSDDRDNWWRHSWPVWPFVWHISITQLQKRITSTSLIKSEQSYITYRSICHAVYCSRFARLSLVETTWDALSHNKLPLLSINVRVLYLAILEANLVKWHLMMSQCFMRYISII